MLVTLLSFVPIDGFSNKKTTDSNFKLKNSKRINFEVSTLPSHDVAGSIKGYGDNFAISA